MVCLDDPHAAECGERAAARGVNVLGYGTAEAVAAHPDVPAGAVITEETVEGSYVTTTVELNVPEHTATVRYQLSVPGRHMVLNSAAALLAGVLAGADPEKLGEGLTDFSGVRRRFEFRGQVEGGDFDGVRVYDDYAHHPTEVNAVLTAARDKVTTEGNGARVIVCFQPHLYSRTEAFAEEFAQALSLADACVVLDIYGARETPVEGVTSRIITDRIADGTEVRLEPDFSAAPRTVASLTKPGDLVLTMGAGSVTLLAPEILRELSGNATPGAEA